jgi:hypothetical protein
MWTRIAGWLFGTAMGRGVLLGGSISIGIAAGWYLFSSHYETKGYEKCQSEQLEAIAKGNVKQANENAEKDKLGSEIAQEALDDAAGVVKEADNNAISTKEDIKDVYKKPPATAPVSFGSCVHPVDQRVQDRIDRAVRQANG